MSDVAEDQSITSDRKTIDTFTERGRVAKLLLVNRHLAGKTQTDVSNMIGVTYQQIQKIEFATNGISAANLLLLCRSLNYDIGNLIKDDPYVLANKINAPKLKQRILDTYKRIDTEIKRQREEAIRYNKMIPKLELEMAHVDTYNKIP